MKPDLRPERRAASDPIPGTPEAEFQAWLAANPVELPDTRKHQLRAPARARSSQGTRWRLLMVVGAMFAVVIVLTGLLTLIGRSRVVTDDPTLCGRSPAGCGESRRE